MATPVSVVMTVLPEAPYLRATLDSLVAQTHQDWELVFVLDGDCPRNRTLVTEVVGAGQVTFVTTPQLRSGVAVGRNTGLAAARHELVALLDADDLAAPTRLAKQALAFDEQPDLGVLGTWAQRIDVDGNRVGELHPPVGREKLARTLLWFNCMIAPSIMLRRSVAQELGGFNPVCTRSEDYDLWLRTLGRHGVDVLGEELLSYRVHPNQHSRGTTLDAQATQLKESRLGAAQRLGVSKVGALARHGAWLGVQVANRRW
jgi:glycosyltransferase involved in cell wall biosynthesis